jgi:hypothetical protein
VNWVSEPVPSDFVPIGKIIPACEEERIFCNRFGTWGTLTRQPLAQWRWDHERDVVLAEDALKAGKNAEAKRQTQQNRKEYLPRVTLGDLRSHQFFPRWEKYPPKNVVRACRKIMADTVDDLLKLGSNSSENDRMNILQKCIELFNELDEKTNFIETAERENICEEFEAIVHACGLGSYQDLADKWRDW